MTSVDWISDTCSQLEERTEPPQMPEVYTGNHIRYSVSEQTVASKIIQPYVTHPYMTLSGTN